jgi:hypothetical protein
MDLGFGPDEWLGVGIVGFNEVINVLPELFDRGGGRVVEDCPFDLVEPGSPRRREMETHVGRTLEPAVVFGLVATMSFMKSRNSMRRRRFLRAVVTLPGATSTVTRARCANWI